MKNGEMRGPRCEVNLVVPCRANGIVAGLEPFEAGERKPAVGLQEVRGVFGTPGDQVFLPGGILGERRRGKISAGKDREHRRGGGRLGKPKEGYLKIGALRKIQEAKGGQTRPSERAERVFLYRR